MGCEHRLRPTQVGVPRDHEPLLPFGEAEKGPLELGEALVEPVDCPAAEQPQVGGHLVVAAAGGVQLPAGVAEPCGQGRLDVEVDVFLGDRVLEPPGMDLAANLLEHVGDRIGLLHGHQAAVGEHPGVGDRAVDVVVGQSPVERHALGEEFHALVGRLAEHAPPGLTLRDGGRSLGSVGVRHGCVPYEDRDG